MSYFSKKLVDPVGKMVVFHNLWEHKYWTYTKDDGLAYWHRLQEAREYAAQHGFKGIVIRSAKGLPQSERTK
jgi:hypothetical protein